MGILINAVTVNPTRIPYFLFAIANSHADGDSINKMLISKGKN